MINTVEILKNISDLPISQRLSIIENLLHSVKTDTLKQIEKNDTNDLKSLYKLFFLTNEAQVLHNVLDTKNKFQISKGNKKLSPTALFGIWEQKPRSLEELRNNNWNRNMSL